MGNLLGDVFFGGQSRTDRKQITDLYKTLGPAAKSATEEGLSAEGDADAYYRNLLHGGQQAQTEAIAPTLNAANAQQQQQRRLLSSEGTSRGGGVNAAQQQGADLASKTAVDALTALAPQAAHGEANVGGALAGQGLQAAQEQGSLAEAERRTNLAHQAAEGSDVAKGIGAVAGMIPTGGGGGFQPTDINPAPTGASGVTGTVPGTFQGPGDWLAALQQQFPELAS